MSGPSSSSSPPGGGKSATEEEETNKSILCVGVCVLDIIHIVNEYPAEDSDLRSDTGRWQRGGNASNNCTVLSQLNQNCEFLGTFSTTEMFDFVIRDLKKNNIAYDNCKYYDGCEPPISSVILVESTGSRTIIHSNPNLPYVNFNDFNNCDLRKYKWVHLEARVPAETIQMIEKIKRHNQRVGCITDKIIISLDLEKPKVENLELAKIVDYVFLGRDFTPLLDCDDMKTAVHRLREKIDCVRNTIICPWGAEGVAVLDKDDYYFTVPSYPPEKVVDTLGAGDTFCAAALYGLSHDNTLESSIEFASRIAGVKVGFYGYHKIRESAKNLKNTLKSN